MAVTLNHKAGTELQNELPAKANVFTQQAVALGNGRAVVFSFEEAKKQTTQTQLSPQVKATSKAVAGRMANKIQKKMDKGQLKLNNTQEKALKTFTQSKGKNPTVAMTFLRTMKNTGMDPTPFMKKNERKVLTAALEEYKLPTQPKFGLSKKKRKEHGTKRKPGSFKKLKAHYIMGKSVERVAKTGYADDYDPKLASKPLPKPKQQALGL